MEFSRQEYWSGLPFPSPGDLPNPGIEPGPPTLQADALSSEPLGMATHYSILARRSPWTEEPGRLQSMGLQRVRLDWVTNTFTFISLFLPGRKKGKKMKSLSCVQLFATPWTVAYQASLSLEFSRQEYWSGLPFPLPGDLPDPGIKPGSPTLWADALPSEPPGKSARRRGWSKSLETLIKGEGINLNLHNKFILVCCAFPSNLP